MSFFGKKATREEVDTRKSIVATTGGRIDGPSTHTRHDDVVLGFCYAPTNPARERRSFTRQIS